MLNVKLLQEVKKWILENPEHLDMEIGLGRNSCGTVACIAGTACMLSAPVPVKQIIDSEDPWLLWSKEALPPSERKKIEDRVLGVWRSMELRAMELLGITIESSADKLFQLPDWENDYTYDYEQADTCEEKAIVVADYIDYFILRVEQGAIAI